MKIYSDNPLHTYENITALRDLPVATQRLAHYLAVASGQISGVTLAEFTSYLADEMFWPDGARVCLVGRLNYTC